MRLVHICLWLSALIPLILAHCLSSDRGLMTHIEPSEQHKRSAGPFLWPYGITVQAKVYPWPIYVRNGVKLRVIRYCFARLYVKQIYCKVVQDAFQVWADALGYPAGPQTGHNIAWEEARDNGPPGSRNNLFCYLPGSLAWNPDVPEDTLRIDIDLTRGNGGSATLGWRPSTGNDAFDTGRHSILLNGVVPVHVVVHELGHVFGMMHEVIRHDRDNFVFYQCKNVVSYQAAFQRARAGFPTWSDLEIDQHLCEDTAFAQQLNFWGHEFAKFINLTFNVADSPTFDMDFIMLYSSELASDSRYCPWDINACPLLKYDPPGQYQTKALISQNTVPSAGDVAFVKRWYPWVGPRSTTPSTSPTLIIFRILWTIFNILHWHQPFASARSPCYTGFNSTTIYSTHNLDRSPLIPRAASALQAQLAQPWPLVTVGTEKLRVLKYCYATKLYRDYLHCSRVNPALKMWADKLGAPASQHGHSVAFKEAGYVGKDGKRKRAYCYTNHEHGKGGKWNENVDKDTLTIYLDPTFDGARATTGWDGSSEEAGRHEMVLGVDADLIEIAHEALTREQKCWGCSVPANTTLVPSIADVVQTGSASFIRGNLAERWPPFTVRNGKRYRGFRYCFENEETKEALTCNGGQFYGAQAMWIKALGLPGEASGHSFAWQEANNGETDRAKHETYFCYNEVVLEGYPRTWNDKVPDDTLNISGVADSTQGRATVGYKDVNKGKRSHEMTLGLKAPAVIIAHEMGHVMGMVHEHNRNDRDDHVRFNCHSIVGFYDALGRAMSMGTPVAEARRRLCEDRDFATQYGFNGPAFLKNEILSGDPGKWGAFDEPGGYDIDSIMHYSSFTFIDNIDACGKSHDHCTLVRIEKDAHGNEVGTRPIDRPKKPSIGDVAWVKRNYC